MGSRRPCQRRSAVPTNSRAGGARFQLWSAVRPADRSGRSGSKDRTRFQPSDRAQSPRRARAGRPRARRTTCSRTGGGRSLSAHRHHGSSRTQSMNGNSRAPHTRLRRVLLALCLGLFACTARERFSPESEAEPSFDVGADARGQLAVFDLSEGAPEQAPSGLFQLSADRTYPGLVRQLSRMLDDDEVKGVFVRLSQQNYDWAQSQELGRMLREFQRKNKRVTCHAHSLTNSTAWLFLRGCDRIWLSPAGEVTSVGIAAQMTYLKGALDKLKIEADFLHMGRFKSGGEPMTQQGPSDASRENLTATLRSIRNTWLTDAADARKQDALKQALEQGPYVPEVAKAKGIIDKVGFESEALAEAKEHADVEHTEVV